MIPAIAFLAVSFVFVFMPVALASFWVLDFLAMSPMGGIELLPALFLWIYFSVNLCESVEKETK